MYTKPSDDEKRRAAWFKYREKRLKAGFQPKVVDFVSGYEAGRASMLEDIQNDAANEIIDRILGESCESKS